LKNAAKPQWFSSIERVAPARFVELENTTQRPIELRPNGLCEKKGIEVKELSDEDELAQ
jgi:hypothetical protein